MCDGAELHNLAKAFSPLFLVSKRCPPKSRPSPCSAQVDDNGPDSSVRYNIYIYIYIVARCRTAWRVKPARERERESDRERESSQMVEQNGEDLVEDDASNSLGIVLGSSSTSLRLQCP